MKKLSAFTIMIVTLSSTAYAESQSDSSYWNRKFTSLSVGSGVVEDMHHNSGTCGPDRPEPKWGNGNRLLGYVCVPYSAN